MIFQRCACKKNNVVKGECFWAASRWLLPAPAWLTTNAALELGMQLEMLLRALADPG